MRLRVLVCLVFCAFLVTGSAGAAQFKEKWVYAGPDYSKDAEVNELIRIMGVAKKIGCTHICTRDPKFGYIDRQDAHYIANITKARKAADGLGLIMVPGVFPIGYSGGYLVHDANLSAGLPVKDAPFVVSGGIARPDPKAVPQIVNPGFDKSDNGRPAGWTVGDAFGTNVALDTAVKHSGAASIGQFNLGSISRGGAMACFVSQKIAVKPFQYYRATIWAKTADFRAEDPNVLILSHGGSRQHSYTALGLGGTEDWKMREFTFNTLDASEIEIALGFENAWGGAIWWDDLKIEPAGLTNVLRTELKPLTVRSADGSVTYVEGKDFAPVKDPVLGNAPHDDPNIKPFPYDVWHKGPDLKIAPGSRIKDGDRLLVSYYHPHFIYQDQVSISIEDPKVFELMDDQMKRMHEAWGAKAYMLAYDEIRMGGWELQPGGAHLTPGELLANHFRKAVAIARKYAPDAKLYTWSDMFDPNHNAHKVGRGGGYYLVNGDWTGSWEGLPKDVGVVTWLAHRKSLEWFAGRGHKQVLAGYYDGDPRSNITMWMNASKGVPNIEGMMYTTWSGSFRQLGNFFQILDSYRTGN